MKLILPKTLPKMAGLGHLPFFFLAGPIQGAGDPHLRLSRLIEERVGECMIANPSRYSPDHPLYQFKIEGDEYPGRQTDWERLLLKHAAFAAKRGAILFWLGEQKEPRTDGSPYARDSYGELGEWRGHMIYKKEARVLIGAEPKFPGLSQIIRNFELALKPRTFEIVTSLEELADQAAALVKR